MSTQDPQIQYPPLLASADATSAEQQQWFYWSTGAQLGALASSALFAIAPAGMGHRVGPIGALIFVLIALGIQISGVVGRSEQRWYEARAAAESVKSASWQFAVGGESFRVEDETAQRRFRQMLSDILAGLPDLDIGTKTGQDHTATSGMSDLRLKSRAERLSAYLEGRVQDQREWYARKASWNKRRATIYMWLVVGLEVLAVLLGLLRASDVIDIELVGFFAACASGILAWTQAKKYSSLAKAYAVTSLEISVLVETLTACSTEEEWAQAVHDSEAAFSREHTMWRARRQGPI